MKDVKLAFLKSRLDAVNNEIKQLEIRVSIYSDRDQEVVKECDAKIAKLNAEWLDLDDELQRLTKVA